MRSSSSQIADLSKEGCRLYQLLLQSPRQDDVKMAPADPYEKLAIANNCANLLYLCRNFTFYNCWGNVNIPILTVAEVEKLATHILDLSRELLENSTIPGILLLFPLRVAGAAATGSLQKDRVTAVLGQVHEHGFAIAKWIRNDVELLWRWQDSMEQNRIV